jgi:hypothetical protein
MIYLTGDPSFVGAGGEESKKSMQAVRRAKEGRMPYAQPFDGVIFVIGHR